MLPFASGQETFKEYLGTEKTIFIILGSIAGVAIFLFFFFWFFACKRNCCRSCKRDFSRSDWRKHEKLKPGIWFVIFNIIGFGLLGLLLY